MNRPVQRAFDGRAIWSAEIHLQLVALRGRERRDVERYGAAVSTQAGRDDVEWMLVVMLRAVIRAALERPDFERKGIGLHARGVHRLAEGHAQRALRSEEGERDVRGLLAAADAMESTGCGRISRPRKHATGVERAIGGSIAESAVSVTLVKPNMLP